MRYFDRFILTFAAVLCFSINLAAQSTSPSSPTPISGQYAGKGPSTETNYYFSFTGGPGDVNVKLQIKAKDYSTFARMEIGNDPANLIAMHNMNASTTTGSATVTKEFKLATKQTVRIKLTLDGNLDEYTLTVNGGGDLADTGTGKTEALDKIGKLGAGSASRIGPLASSGSKPKPGVQGSTVNAKESKVSFQCPSEIMYKIVPTGDWNPTLYGQKRYLFDSAAVDGPRLLCTYTNVAGAGDSATLMKQAPAGYSCEVYDGGPKSRDLVCTIGAAAKLSRPMDDWQSITW